MFLPYNLDSVNSREQLPSTDLAAVCTIYRSKDKGRVAAFLVYSLEATGMPVAADFLIRDEDGQLYMRDFMVTHDGLWRDSAGEATANLEALVPPELLKMVAGESFELPVGANVEL